MVSGQRDNVELNEPTSFLDVDIPEHADPMFQVDDIKCEYHPSSGMAPEFCNRCTSWEEKFTFQNHKDIRNTWDAVSNHITGCFSKLNGKTFIHFTDEPFTANTFWNVQSQLPPGGKPLAFILYADKTRLSSFGTARGYPIVARLANLPTDIHNGQGVKEDRDHAGKPSWVNFKNAVWHESFLKILSPLASKSHTGQWFQCLDSVQWWFFPFILILLADYEEHLSRSPRQTFGHIESQEVLKAAQAKETAEEKEEKLKEYGLRHITMVIHASHTILTEDDCLLGYLLLCCICLFLELNAYAALEVHTTETISASRHAIQAFSTYLHQYIDKSADESDKNWNFPKLHMSSHIFDNIEVKGATRNYNTKPNEKMHGSLKDLYLLRTNFRDVAPQILRINHWQVAAESIRRHISDLNEYES
ncbi:uncharacterized protein HD556DRAFT_1309046 [Suillus plorans]|uniref:Uncharacterized protein n=1 Tax=Suillus plorans TaxID=116603 RepID=A0A9P7AMR9_9AGAM|nr:uncharacterized protein HD556DRAFT_1309046 [Suillus plorans]KAG1792747.1 hypothetical protein HD556DRAFT_1309046 [Suillus plorans]